jgi:hypothetical protein
VVCIGYPEEKILMLLNGERLVNAIILTKNINPTLLLLVKHVPNALGFNHILLAFLAIKNGKIMLLYLKPTKREFK